MLDATLRVRSRTLLAAALASILALPAASGAAAELSVLSGGAAKSGLVEAAQAYTKRTGTMFALEFQPMGPLLKKLDEGHVPDVVVLTAEAMAEAEKKGLVVRETATEVGRVGIGVAVHERAPAPDVSTPDALKRALLAAKSIVYIDPARGTSGRHFAQVLERLGIAEQIRAKTTLGAGGYVVEPVGRGEIELGVHQITEILPVKGVKLVGPLPAELQKETVYVGAATAKSPKRADAQAFLAFLRAPETRAIFADRGYIEKR